MNVIIVRIPAPSGFTQVPNAVLRDERLSYKARGIHANLLTNADQGWNETADTLADKSPDGRHAVRTGLQELVAFGYIEYRKAQGPDGKWATEMVVYSSPKSENLTPVTPTPEVDVSVAESPQVAPGSENPTSVYDHTGAVPENPQVVPESGFPNVGPPNVGSPDVGKPDAIQNTKQNTKQAEPASKPARATAHQSAETRPGSAAIPDWAMPLVQRIQQAGLPGLRWNLASADWLLLDALIKTKGIEAMADYATRAAESATRPVASARYFLNGWKELPAAPPAGTPTPTPLGSRPSPADQRLAGIQALKQQLPDQQLRLIRGEIG